MKYFWKAIGVAAMFAVGVGAFWLFESFTQSEENLALMLEGRAEEQIFAILDIDEAHRGAFNTDVAVTMVRGRTEVKVCFQLNTIKQYQVPAKYRSVLHRGCELEMIDKVNPSFEEQHAAAIVAAAKLGNILRPYFK